MSDNEIEERVIRIRGLISTGRDKISSWAAMVPEMERTDEQLAWIQDSIGKSPSAVENVTNEELLDYLDKSEKGFSIFNDIPDPPSLFLPLVSTTGSATASSYAVFVNDVKLSSSDQPKVTNWAKETLASGRMLWSKQRRSETVRSRLFKLHPDLVDLYDDAVKATLTSKAGVQTPVEAASTQNRLLDQFKGALIARCRKGKGANYQRISDNLAVDTALTRTVVAAGQQVHDSLNRQLVPIRKSMTTSTGDHMKSLLERIEDHIIVITDALDQSKLGVTFDK